MRLIFLIFIGMLLVAISSSKVSSRPKSEITVVQINAKWNNKNTRTDLSDLEGVDYRFGWLEDQPESIKRNTSVVPVIVIYKGNNPTWQYIADISFTIAIPIEEIQAKVNEIKADEAY